MDDKQFSQELNGIKAFIEDYLLTRCQLKGKLQDRTRELDRFFRNTAYGKEQLERHKLDIDTYIKQCALYGNEYIVDTYKYHIEFQEIEVHNENCRVTFTTNEVKKFRCTDEMTMIKESPQNIMLYKQRGRWFIEEHLTSLEFFESLQVYQKMTGIQELERVQQVYLEEVSRIKGAMKPYSIKATGNNTGYKRDEAVKYALKYALEPDDERSAEEGMDESTRFAIRCLEQGGWRWSTKQMPGTESQLRKGDIVKISNLTEGIHSMIVTEYIYSLFNSHKVIGYLVSQHGGCEKNVPLATKPYPREYVLID